MKQFIFILSILFSAIKVNAQSLNDFIDIKREDCSVYTTYMYEDIPRFYIQYCYEGKVVMDEVYIPYPDYILKEEDIRYERLKNKEKLVGEYRNEFYITMICTYVDKEYKEYTYYNTSYKNSIEFVEESYIQFQKDKNGQKSTDQSSSF